MQQLRANHKTTGQRKQGFLRRLRQQLVKNWCLKRSRALYAVASLCLHKSGLRINIAMRCRPGAQADWGHAWVSQNGEPLWERHNRITEKRKTMIADTGKYIYWIFN